MYFQLCSASLQRRKAVGKEGTGANGCSRSQSPESGMGAHPAHPASGQQNRSPCPTAATVPVCRQCHGVMQYLASVTQRCFQDHYKVFLLWKTGRGLCTPHPAGMPISPGTRAFTHWCFACARGNLPARVLPAGTGAECVAMGTSSCHEVIFFPMPGQAPGELIPFQHTRGCSEVWALLLCIRQVTSHVLTCGLVCREKGCCRAGHTEVACLVVAVTQSWATMSLPWGEEAAEGCLRSATGAGHSCSHTRTHTLPPLWQAKRHFLYLTGGSCLQPGHHLHVKSQGPQHLIPRGQSLPVPIAWATRVQTAEQSVAVLL